VLMRNARGNDGEFSFSSSRSKDIVEPLIKPQWYVDCKEMADMAVKVNYEKHDAPCY